MTTSEALVEFLRTKIKNLDPSLPLARQLNSLELYSLVDDVEKTFGISFFSIELNDENLKTVDSWAALIDRKRREAT